jgi:inner membrane protein
MLFAHAPAGFLAAYLTRKIWSQKLSNSQINLLYLLGTIFGIFPDIDAIYYYLFSAILRHREFFTHSLIFYLIVWLVVYLVWRITKKEFLKASSFVFLFASLLHLLLDSLGYGVMWLYPYTNLTFGILNIETIASSFFGKNFLVINLVLETIIILLAINFLVFKFFKEYLKFVIASSYLIFLIAVLFLYVLTPYLYFGQPGFYYKDKDNDKIINLRDRDLDGDGILNIKDFDADGDGRKNISQIIETAKKLEGVKYDKSNGKFWEIFTRSGFLTKTDVVIIPYNYAGIFFKKEMEEDFVKFSFRYEGRPKKSRFSRNPYNLFIFFRNRDMLEDEGQFTEGDVVFFGEKAENIALVINGSKNRKVRVLMADSNKIKFLSIDEAKEKYGKVIGVGRLNYK